MKHTLFRVSIWDGDCIVASLEEKGVQERREQQIAEKQGKDKPERGADRGVM